MLRAKINKRKIRIIFNGIDLSRFSSKRDTANLRKNLDIKEDIYVVGTVGRLTEEKGHKILIQAARKIVVKYPNVTFVVAG